MIIRKLKISAVGLCIFAINGAPLHALCSSYCFSHETPHETHTTCVTSCSRPCLACHRHIDTCAPARCASHMTPRRTTCAPCTRETVAPRITRCYTRPVGFFSSLFDALFDDDYCDDDYVYIEPCTNRYSSCPDYHAHKRSHVRCDYDGYCSHIEDIGD